MPWLTTASYSDLLVKAARVDALQAEAERLLLTIEELKQERADLLNRLLEKSQIRPLSEPMPAPRPQAPVFPVISPFQAIDEQTEELARAAWVEDLAEGYVDEKRVDIETARRMAQSEYTRRYQPLN